MNMQLYRFSHRLQVMKTKLVFGGIEEEYLPSLEVLRKSLDGVFMFCAQVDCRY